MGALIKLPTAATPAEQILSRFNRDQLAGFIEVAISLLDIAEPDTDLEDADEDRCPAGDDDLTPRWAQMGGAHDNAHDDDCREVSAWTEWHTRGRHKIGEFGEEQCRTLGTPKMAHEDAEDDDPVEENGDEQDSGLAEDEELPGLASHWGRYWNGGRAGCPISDPGGGPGEEACHACPTFGIDQTQAVSEGEAFHDLNGIPLIRVPLSEKDR